MKTLDRPMKFPEKIVNSKEAIEYLDMLYTADLAYHPEDSASNIIHKNKDDEWVPLFSPDIVEHLDDLMDQVWDHVEDPCEYLLLLIEKSKDHDA